MVWTKEDRLHSLVHSLRMEIEKLESDNADLMKKYVDARDEAGRECIRRVQAERRLTMAAIQVVKERFPQLGGGVVDRLAADLLQEWGVKQLGQYADIIRSVYDG